MWILVLQRMVLEFLFDLVYFPVWWYTGGAKRMVLFCWHLLGDGNAYLAPGLWLRNIFVPMFGQTDWQGRLVSVFMRLINVIGRSIGLLIWLLVVLVLWILWIIAPLVILYFLYHSFI